MSLDSMHKLIGRSEERDTDSTPKSWRSYWEVPAISGQKPEHLAQSQYYVEQIERTIPLNPRMRVLDFGCGFGFVADALAGKVAEVWLWDTSKNMRDQALRLNASRRNVRLLDLSNEQTERLPVSFDLIIVNSVVQYMTMEELSAWLTRWLTMVAADGRIVLSDLMQPGASSPFQELYESFMFNVKRGLLMHLMSPSNISALKRYARTTRAAKPLLLLNEHTLRHVANEAGLSVELLPSKLTYFSKRLTAVLRLRV